MIRKEYLRVCSILAMLVLASGASAFAQSTSSPKPAEGGSNQRGAVEGCVDEWLFNGIWRFKVLSVDSAATFNNGSAKGTGIRVQIRNATAKEMQPSFTGVSDGNLKGVELYYSDENTVEPYTHANPNDGSPRSDGFLDRRLGPGVPATITIYFPLSGSAKPVKLIVPVDTKAPANQLHVKYSVKDPSFRVKLDCDGTAKSPASL